MGSTLPTNFAVRFRYYGRQYTGKIVGQPRGRTARVRFRPNSYRDFRTVRIDPIEHSVVPVNLDQATRKTSAFNSFSELRQAALENGYRPTLYGDQFFAAILANAFDRWVYHTQNSLRDRIDRPLLPNPGRVLTKEDQRIQRLQTAYRGSKYTPSGPRRGYGRNPEEMTAQELSELELVR